MSVYKIHEDNIARLEDKLKKIEKKCAKLGCTYNYRIVDKLGNIFIWRTSNWLDLDKFDFTKVTFTVKNHDEFRGVLQTEVTRCKFAK